MRDKKHIEQNFHSVARVMHRVGGGGGGVGWGRRRGGGRRGDLGAEGGESKTCRGIGDAPHQLGSLVYFYTPKGTLGGI